MYGTYRSFETQYTYYPSSFVSAAFRCVTYHHVIVLGMVPVQFESWVTLTDSACECSCS